MFSMAPLPTFPRQPMQHPVKNSEELLDAEMYIDPWIGWRCWNVKADTNDVWLESITYNTKWLPGQEITAKCVTTHGVSKIHEDEHTTPDMYCGCGIYSVTSIEEAKVWQEPKWLAIVGQQVSFRCMGEVKLWGKVLRFTKGYLAEHAYPKSLLIPHIAPEDFTLEPTEVVHELRKRYRGVEVNLL